MLRRRLAHAAERSGDLETSVRTWRDLVKDYPNEPVNQNNLARVEKKLEASRKSASASGSQLVVAFTGLLAATFLPAMLQHLTHQA